MISEKTVELNLTAELINWASLTFGKTYFALAPSQQQESKLGFDVSVQTNGTGLLIQYKRAYVDGDIWLWHLNRTKLKDQHLRLQNLENTGIPVFYAFPYFHTPIEIETWRKKLLKKTFWYRPSQINPYGGPMGHHEVFYNTKKGQWFVKSTNEIELPPPQDLNSVFKQLEKNTARLNHIFEAFNDIMTSSLDKESIPLSDSGNLLGDLMQGISVLAERKNREL